ncbi:LPXTG cell wall anchor domain-containing protein [Lacticaseibacillus kribbianus]|uniref:LPXTG cell wall anchor domain-containing protein n=1 Tax=Lacticaseibacillus kribbianus TaxID=2926292 RepID=UPI001CD51BD2|nr:LPXTG cell wall anchor domain-containing protein [Lacticaseibacillus kribbianus]
MVRFNTLALAVLVSGSFGAAGASTAHAATTTAPVAGTSAIASAAATATGTTAAATDGTEATGAAAQVAPALDINNIELWLEGERLVQSGVNTVVADHLYHGEALLSYSGAGATLPLSALQLTSNNPNVVIETGEGTLVTGADGVTRISLPYTLVVHGEVGPNPIVVSIGIQRTDGGVVHGTSQGQSFIIGSTEPGDGDGGDTGNPGDGDEGNPEDPGDGDGGNTENPGDGDAGNPEDPGDGDAGNPEDPGDGDAGNPEDPGDGDAGTPEKPGDGNEGNPEKPSDGDESATETPADSSTPSKPTTPGVAHPVAERPTATHDTARQLPQTGERKAPVLVLAGLVLVALSVAVGASQRWRKDA